MSAEEVDRRAAPFVAAIGEAVIGAAALERVLLADIGARRLQDQSTYAALAQDLSDLENAPLVGFCRVLGSSDSPRKWRCGSMT